MEEKAIDNMNYVDLTKILGKEGIVDNYDSNGFADRVGHSNTPSRKIGSKLTSNAHSMPTSPPMLSKKTTPRKDLQGKSKGFTDRNKLTKKEKKSKSKSKKKERKQAPNETAKRADSPVSLKYNKFENEDKIKFDSKSKVVPRPKGSNI